MIEGTATNFFQYAAFISPFLLGFFLVLSSIFNQDIKGFIYLGGVLISSVINIFLQNIVSSERSSDSSPICNLVSFNIMSPNAHFDSPNSSSAFIAFTLAYLILPMFYNNQMNYTVLIFIISLFIIDTITKLANKCTTLGGAFMGALTGFIFGSLWFSIFYAQGNTNLLYFNEFVSNNTVCSRPSEQTFRCSVYKNGTLISSNIA